MNKSKTLLTVVMIIAMLASCGIDDLEKRVDKIEDRLGYDEPIKINITTTNYDDEVVTEKGPFMFEGNSNTGGIYDYGDGTYYIWVERFTHLDFDNGSVPSALLALNYDATTGEVTFAEITFDFVLDSGVYLEAFFSNDGGSEVTFDVEVTSFNPETGSINLNFEGTSTDAYSFNAFEGEAMQVTGSFKGKLKYSLD